MLVPARNAAEQLPVWLRSVDEYADRVIALDDGSTDSTRELLAAHPRVACVLTNPVRPTYHGWDDLANRQRLVHAALALGARWLLFLDADETLDAADGRALREFVGREAVPGFAYGFENVRMVEDDAHFDPRSLWVYRLFHARDASSPLGSKRLHFVPVPRGIPRQQWLQTSIRIRHFGSLTSAHREARFAKYAEADPHNDFQRDYTGLLEDPVRVLPWPSRDPGVPVLLGARGRFADHVEDDLSSPAISVVVIARNDAEVIERVVEAAVRQVVNERFEVIVVGSGTDDTIARVRHRFPQVRCVQLPRRALPGEARNAGLWMARGDYITFPGSHVELLPGSIQARLDAHENGWELVSGGVVNGNHTKAGWASYVLDHISVTRSRPAGSHRDVPGAASYVTSQVRAIGGFPEDMRAGEDTVVNRTLTREGKRAYFCPDAAFVHTSRATTVPRMMRHHFQRGRAWGRIVRASSPSLARRQLLQRVLKMPRRRLKVIAKWLPQVDDDTRREARLVRGAVTAGILAATTGASIEVLTGGRSHPDAGPASTHGARPARGRPILAIGGRCGSSAPSGLLSAGNARQSARRLQTFAAYGSSVCDVTPALAPIITSATLTHELNGTNTLDVVDAVVDSYHRAADAIGARLIVQLQPGRLGLAELLQRWRHWIERPGVDVLLDVRDRVAFGGQRSQLGAAIGTVRAIGGADTIVLVRGAEHPDAVTATFLDLREPQTPWPHEAFSQASRPAALVYQ